MEGARTADKRRQQILDAFLECMIEKPYDAISVRDIARGAGVTLSTIYYYFENKEAILLEHIAARMRQYTDIFEVCAIEAAKNSGDMKSFVACTVELAKRYFEGVTPEGLRVSSMIWCLGNYNPAVKKLLRETYETADQSLQRVIAHAGFATPDPSLTSKLIACLFDGIFVYNMIFSDQPMDVRLLEHLGELI